MHFGDDHVELAASVSLAYPDEPIGTVLDRLREQVAQDVGRAVGRPVRSIDLTVDEFRTAPPAPTGVWSEAVAMRLVVPVLTRLLSALAALAVLALGVVILVELVANATGNGFVILPEDWPDRLRDTAWDDSLVRNLLIAAVVVGAIMIAAACWSHPPLTVPTNQPDLRLERHGARERSSPSRPCRRRCERRTGPRDNEPARRPGRHDATYRAGTRSGRSGEGTRRLLSAAPARARTARTSAEPGSDPMKRLRNRQLTRSRVLVFIVGVILAAVGVIGLLLSTDTVARITKWADQSEPLLNADLDQSISDNRVAYQLGALAFAVVCIIVGFLWLRSQIPRPPPSSGQRVPEPHRRGRRSQRRRRRCARVGATRRPRDPPRRRPRHVELRADDQLIRITLTANDTIPVADLAQTVIAPATERAIRVGSYPETSTCSPTSASKPRADKSPDIAPPASGVAHPLQPNLEKPPSE